MYEYRTVFLTFGGGNRSYRESVNRIKLQASKFRIFNNIIAITDIDLSRDKEFWNRHSEFIRNNNRGFGYWIWKPYIILKTLNNMKNGDVLLYCDSGCELNYKKKDHMNNLINMANQKHLIVTHSSCIKNIEWTKKELFDFMGLSREQIGETAQLQATVIMLKKTDTIMSLINEWYNIACNYNIINDSLNKYIQYPEFREHRHDQSIFSLLCLKYNLVNTDIGNTYFESEGWAPQYINSTSILTIRNRTGRSMLNL
jgi:hypothetical protein